MKYTIFLLLLLTHVQLNGNVIDDILNCLGIVRGPTLYEQDGEIVECHLGEEGFTNWGENISFAPKYVFVPKTKIGVCNIVKWAAEQNLKIRASGYRHTWNPVYPDPGQILISLLGLEHVDSHLPPSEDDTGAGKEFRTIEFVPGSTEPDKIFCKIGGAVTNDELRAFCLENRDPFYQKYWSLPLNVILVENSFSGTISSICHGAGFQNQTLSDLVQEIEFVNAKGELQVINKKDQPELMKAAAGSFGLLGIITSITLKLDKMAYALTYPKFLDLAAAVPPPQGTQLSQMPLKLREDLNLTSQEMLDSLISQNTEPFFRRCESDYAEWFWFILDNQCWINCWDKDDPQNDFVNQDLWENGGGEIYFNLQTWIENGISSFSELFNSQNIEMPPPPFQEGFVRTSTSVITGLLPCHPQTLPMPEALHFQRGIRHTQVRDVEIEIPVSILNGKPDWSICQQAWWDAIYSIYDNLEDTGTLPINLTLEMRIMGGSDITLAAQKGNSYTCSIEVLSTMLVPHEDWKPAAEEIIADWISTTKNPRTHWAKEWYGLDFDGKDGKTFVKDSYREEIPKFKQQLSDIALIGGYTLDDMQKRFSNALWDEIIFQSK